MKVRLKMSEAQEPFSFSFVNTEGRALLRSENYKVKKSALNGIESVKKNCLEAGRYEYKVAKNGKLFFNIKASNGQVVGTSALFDTEQSRADAADEIRVGAPNAPLEE